MENIVLQLIQLFGNKGLEKTVVKQVFKSNLALFLLHIFDNK